jgi:CheY-like chemotaxis protein
MRTLLLRALANDGHRVQAFGNGAAALDHLRAAANTLDATPQVLITDIRMPGLSGLEMMAALRDLRCDVHTIVMTAFGSRATHEEALALGALTVLDKPFDVDELRDALQRLDLEG